MKGRPFCMPASRCTSWRPRRPAARIRRDGDHRPRPSAGPIPHAHDEFDEAIYVLSGRLLVVGDGEPQKAVPGSMFVAPRGYRHGFSNPSDEQARVLGLWAPPEPALALMQDIGAALRPDTRQTRTACARFTPGTPAVFALTHGNFPERRSQSLLENWPAGGHAPGCSWADRGVSLTGTPPRPVSGLGRARVYGVTGGVTDRASGCGPTRCCRDRRSLFPRSTSDSWCHDRRRRGRSSRRRGT